MTRDPSSTQDLADRTATAELSLDTARDVTVESLVDPDRHDTFLATTSISVGLPAGVTIVALAPAVCTADPARVREWRMPLPHSLQGPGIRQRQGSGANLIPRRYLPPKRLPSVTNQTPVAVGRIW